MLIRLSSVALAASLLSAAPCLALSVEDIPADTPVSALLSSAQSHLSRGETSEALMYYDAAITKNPNDYLTFFKRATTYLSLGRLNHATEDFNQVLVLKPGFEGAHLQLAKIRQRGADWDGAREQYVAAGKKADSQEVIDMEVAQNAVAAAMAAEASQNWAECDEHASTAILIANRAVSLRELRSRCRFAKGDVASAMGDLQHVLSMKPGDTSPHLRISALQFYALDDAEKGMAQARKCLHSDPDSKVCAKLLRQEKNVGKTIAKVAKSFSKKQYTTGNKHMVPSGEDKGLVQEVKEQWQKLQEDGTVPAGTSSQLVSRLVSMVCQGYFESNSKKAKEYCDEALKLDENALYGLLYKHKTLLQDESFEAAIKILEQASEAHPDAGETINPLMQEAQVKLKRSKTKDYYKILGVAHDADERQIKSAYRRASKQHHPDKAKAQGLSKEAAEKKMAGINEAYEVLSNPELRQRFDNGDDPMSNEQQNPFAGQNPFGGGHPFMFQQGGGGGGQQFNFKFGSGGFPGGFPFGG